MKTLTLNNERVTIPTIRPLYTPSGSEAKNQYVIEMGDKEIFQSYETIIAVKTNGKVYLDPKHDCSNTTAKYRNIFLGMKKPEILKEIEKGNIIITDLN